LRSMMMSAQTLSTYPQGAYNRGWLRKGLARIN
jgi:hypothetical protein